MTLNLFDSPSGVESWQERLGPGAVSLRSFAASDETTLLAALRGVIAMAPFPTWSRRAVFACRWR
jgi:hypothetical protein